MTDEHRPEKPPEHRPENNQQQPEHTEHRPDNYLDPDLAEMYKDSQYLIDADGFRLDPEPAAPTPPIPDPGPRIAFEQADSDPQWGSPDPSGPIQEEEGSDPFEFRPNPSHLGNHPDPFEFRSNPSQLGVEGEGSPTEETDESWPYGEVSRTDVSDAHQPGGFHPSYENQWPYGEIRPEEGVEAWPYGEVRPTEDEDSLRLDPDPAAPALPPPDPGAPRIASDQADPNPSLSGVEGEVNPEAVNPWPYGEESALNPWQNPWIMEPPEPVDVIVNSDPKPPPPWPYGEVRPTEDAQEPWPYGETNPTGAASFLEQSDAGMGLGDLADPRLTEDPSTAVHPEVQEQEDFFEGV